jgi:hypothetical protein
MVWDLLRVVLVDRPSQLVLHDHQVPRVALLVEVARAHP